ncbi:hypothetical protein SKAU_G00427330 [Synaphobranchus kaupii]|uniref:Protein downstream neighbor of Son n=1 Tax=Synaphobranchus kaupii TaxID=118154 RepID=A0A9Q1E4W7_SYNKA|nr:hypothetical protein SKAU_G00427330 [Synaphobranchus kaupii]
MVAGVEKQTEGPDRGDTPQFTERLLHAEKRNQDAPNKDKKQSSVSGDDSIFEEDLFSDEKISPPILKSPHSHGPGEMAPPVCLEYPADWSLKTRLLFTSPLSFSWAEQLKAQEEAQGLSQHCRATHVTLPQNIQEPRCSSELRCSFLQALQYWQHPSLPWLPLFPRIGADRKFSGKSAPWAHDAALQLSLMSEWSVSFTSLYSLLKARLCPYFYLCSYQFTALFRASGLNGTTGISAVLSPTTRGLREAMRTEGIDFKLPLLEEKRKCRDHGSIPQTEEHRTEPRELSAEEENEEYSVSIKLHKEQHEVKLDHRPESLVLVDGSNTFTLLNFLINCKSLVAAAGAQAGLPPHPAGPHRLQRGHTARAQGTQCEGEETAQRGDFAAGLYTHEPTAVFNTPAGPPLTEQHAQDAALQDLEGCGLHPSTVQQLLQPSTLEKRGLRHLHMKESSYTWTT